MVVAAVACAVAVGAAGCGSSKERGAEAASTSPITILWVGDTTGPLKAYGDVQLAGVRGAAEYYNSRGGIAGHRVVVHAVSDNGDPTTAATVLTRELASSTPTMVWAGSVSSDSAAMIPILARRRVFAIGLVDGQAQCRVDAATKCPNFWSLANPTSVAQQGVVDWIKARHFTRVGLLEETTPFSVSETPHFLRAAGAAGLTVKTASFPASAVDLGPQLQALHRAGSEVIYAEGLGTAQYALTARADLDWNVPVVFDSSASAVDITKLATPANVVDAFEAPLYEQDARLPNPGLRTMTTWAGRHAKVTALPLSVTSTGWDAVVTFNTAVTQAGGSLDVAKLNAAMLHLPPTDPLRTLTHKLGWTADSHENVLGAPEDYAVIPVGPLVNGRVQAP
ncbi:MAG: Extracellular ligand-binding receptor [Conexibacter sp.]|nr:Extracellular ligand-binding receptor [Conexibacter sp.]